MAAGGTDSARNAASPNIVVILSDDQGPWALGCAGNGEIRTPNLDRLAAGGTRLDRFFCASPVCSPARASLLTGQIPSQHGVHDWLAAGNMPSDPGGPIRYLDGKPSYTQVLAARGYTCGLSGKWHLGDSMVPQHGFSHWYCHQKGGGPYYGAPMIREGRPVTETGYLTDAITDDAIAFLEARASGRQPFYLSVNYTAPHSPWVDSHPEDIVASYADCPFASIPRDPVHPWAVPGWTPELESEQWWAQLRGYFAAVTAMDAGIGRILDRLDALGVREHTLVVFLSDNGFNTGHHGLWGKGNSSFPLNMYDTSVLVPAIFSLPGRIPKRVVRSEMVSGYDFSHTLLDLVGLAMPNASELPGRSFAELLRSGARRDAGRDHIVVYDEYGPVRMIRTEAWKYVHRYPYGPHELYDLAVDPGELDNRVDDPACREVVESLRGRLDAWFRDYVDSAVDGAREPVTGTGQVDRAGAGNAGRLAYLQDQRLRTEAAIRSKGRSG
jgi:arylsulfatase A-like enzyme